MERSKCIRSEYSRIGWIFLPLLLITMEAPINRQVGIISQGDAENVTVALTALAIMDVIESMLKSVVSPSQSIQIFIVLVNTRKDFWSAVVFVTFMGFVTAGVMLTLGLTPCGDFIQIAFDMKEDERIIFNMGIASVCLAACIGNIDVGLKGLLSKRYHIRYCLMSGILRLLLKIVVTFGLMQTDLASRNTILIPVISQYACILSSTVFLIGAYIKLDILGELPASIPTQPPLDYLRILRMILPMGAKELTERLEPFILYAILRHTARNDRDRNDVIGYLYVVHQTGFMLIRGLFATNPLVTIYLSNTKMFDYREKYHRLVIFTIATVTIVQAIIVSFAWIPQLTRFLFVDYLKVSDEKFNLVTYPFKLWTFSPIIYGLYMFSLGVVVHSKDTKILLVCSVVQLILSGLLPYLFSLIKMSGLISGTMSVFLINTSAAFILLVYNYIHGKIGKTD
ncbi:unnamed protein product [Owenia fusiformis]|uniref:Uncharacterized protein n=1 Tax=Owenia fusiformis TaxID=6347 RepID=A0A8J1Y2V2_OWEFU|nr:unnamed protein product [Owenia fusiformis]